MKGSKAQWTASEEVHFSEAGMMDYLHGDIPENEVRMACMYEYARESETLWKVAKQRDIATKDKKSVDLRTTVGAVTSSYWPLQPIFALFLRIHSFPHRSWTKLSAKDLKQIMRYAQRD